MQRGGGENPVVKKEEDSREVCPEKNGRRTGFVKNRRGGDRRGALNLVILNLTEIYPFKRNAVNEQGGVTS